MAGGANFGVPGSYLFLQDGEPFNTYVTTNKSYGVQVGTRGRTRDGREWLFIKAGGSDLAPGKLHQDTAPASTSVGLTAVAASIGATSISAAVGAAAITKDQYAGGLLVIEDGPGIGQVFNIKSHPASAGSENVAFVLAESQKVAVALTTASRVSLILPFGTAGIIHGSPPTAEILGVPVVTIVASTFGWVCRKGAVSVLQQGALTAGKSVAPSATVDGAVFEPVLTEGTPNTGATEAPIGIALRNVGDTKYALVELNLP